ncbi:MAG: flagellar motor protein MotB [Alphaproteobacteria bacterium]
MAKKQEECAECEEWMSTYGDMVTLLMCFFVLLASSSKVDIVLFEQIRAGMAKGIGDRDVVRPVELIMVDLADDIKSMKIGEGISLGSDHQGVVMEFASASFFDSGSAEIKQEALPILNKIASTLKAERYRIFKYIVEGHTDDQDINTEMYPSNWELSSARASSFVRFFLSKNIEPTRLKAVGLADTMPKVPNRDAYGEPIPHNMELNRRVIVRIEPIQAMASY